MSAVHAGHVRCRRCSKFRHPAEFIGGPYGYCATCYETHRKAMTMLTAQVPPACQECGVSEAELSARSPNVDIKMQVHIKDGIYQVLCEGCGTKYARGRSDLYQGTPFAKQLTL